MSAGFNVPIYSAIKNYIDENTLRCHMPGHIGGQGFMPPELKNISNFDLTEVPGLDNLHIPQEAIKKAQILLARAFRAKRSYFLVNGASSGLQTLLLSTCSPGDKVLLQRNSHISLFGGMVLSGVMPVYMPSQVQPDLGLELDVKPDTVQQFINANQDAIAVFITSPAYCGITCQVEKIANYIRKPHQALLVDEAHGGHFYFHPSYPVPALHSGADAVVNGLHKTWPVLNQGAVLHTGSCFLAEHRIPKALSLLTTTSPSYPILASIDLARAFMEEKGRECLERGIQLSGEYTAKISKLRGFKCGKEIYPHIPDVRRIDPLKLLISVEGLDIDGYRVSEILRYQYGIQIETQGTNYILAMMSMFHQKDDWDRLYKALNSISSAHYSMRTRKVQLGPTPYPQVELTPREAFFSKKRRIPFKDASGKISAEAAAVYPPGTPCLLPGELITDDIIGYICSSKAAGAKLYGIRDSGLNWIDIIDL
jgi:arginine decarboxylase